MPQDPRTPHPHRSPLVPGCSLVLLFILFCLAPGPALAVPPTRLVAGAPAAALERGNLYVRLSLTVDHEEGLRDMLKDGAVLELRLTLTLERKRSWWTDAESAGREYISVIMHDPLSRDFIVLAPGADGEKEMRDRNLTRLLHGSWRSLVLPLATAEELKQEDPEAEFTIGVAASLRHTDVPPWLEKSIIWSSDVVPSIALSLPFSLPKVPQPSP